MPYKGQSGDFAFYLTILHKHYTTEGEKRKMYKRGKKKNGIGRCLKIGAAGIALLLGAVMLPSSTQAADLSGFSNTLSDVLPVFGTTTNTYLDKTDSGWQAVVEDGEIHIIDFDQNWNQMSERTLEYELPIFGAYYSGETYNYLIFGQKGTENGTEIYRIVKYDKEFNRLGSVSIPYESCYTRVPFDKGNVSVAESGNQMVVYTARTRPDGHQSNIAIRINTDTMTVEDYGGMGSLPDIHVSHSLREIVKYDGDNPVYVDLGDTYPRAVCLQEKPGTKKTVLSVPGAAGNNETDTDVSGLEITDTGYLVVGTQLQMNCNNIYLSYVGKGSYSGKVTWLTRGTVYDYDDTCNAKIVKTGDRQYAVMWNSYMYGGSVDYVMVNGSGEVISGLKSKPGAELTECQPVYADGKVSWLKYSDGEMSVFSLDDFSCTGSYEASDNLVEAADPWTGDIDTEWYSEEASEYTLEHPEQLAGLAELVNSGNTFEGKTIRIGQDMFFNKLNYIDYEWTPIASEGSGIEFQGTFDGQGHTLYNMYVASGAGGGLFGTIGENGIVKAVNMKQGNILEKAAVAKLNKGWILFCENSGYVSNSSSYVGGICSVNENLIYGCGNKGMVQSNRDCGGVVGQNGDDAIIDSCWNEGFVGSDTGVIGGLVSDNNGQIRNSYNSGTVCDTIWLNHARQAAGIAGESRGTESVKNCYNAGYLSISAGIGYYTHDDVCCGTYSWPDNVYTTSGKYTGHSDAVVVTTEELGGAEMAERLNGDDIFGKWQSGSEDINRGLAVPAARMDIESGIYKMLPYVESPVTEVSISLSDTGYQLQAFSGAYYGLKEAEPVYSTDSDILTITETGVITPIKEGTAVVLVQFAETEHTKEAGFEVTVNVSGNKGDVTGDGQTDIADLRLVLRAVCGKVELTDAQTSAADVETDGKVDIQDLRKILRFVCGKIETW